MYSIVMMTALSATPDAPQFNGYFRDLFSRDSRSGCAGCNGCAGGVRYSCVGGGCSGAVAYPTSCNGCTGCNGCAGSCSGGVFGLGDRVRSWFQRDTSGCYGCCGASYSCSGCTGCSGYSCSGASFSCFGAPMAYSGYGGIPLSSPVPTFDAFPGAPRIPFAVPDTAPGAMGRAPVMPAQYPAPTLTSSGPTGRATVIVKLPVDARLTTDGHVLKLTGAERKFVSPELPQGQEFVYRFKAEYERDGEMLSMTKKVTVQAGSTLTIEFAELIAAKPSANPAKTTATTPPTTPEPVKAAPPVRETPAAPTSTNDRATITVKLPPGATLYVDDRKNPSNDPVRQFATPPLPANSQYAYLLKAEVIRNGQPETLTQKVPFRAGERITVDFTTLGK